MTNRIAQHLTPEPDPERRPEDVTGDPADLGGKTLPTNPESVSASPTGTDADAEERAAQNGLTIAMGWLGESKKALRAATDQTKAPPVDWPLVRKYVREKLTLEQIAHVDLMTDMYEVWDQAVGAAFRELHRAERN